MWSLAAITLGALPLAKVVSPKAPVRHAATGDHSTPWDAVGSAMGDGVNLPIREARVAPVPAST